jgi:DNA anti-recombination protein RmuC
MSAVREAWTDERLDDLAVRMEDGFAKSEQRDKELRREVKSQSSELRAEIAALGAEMRESNQALGKELRESNETLGKELRREMQSFGQELRGEMVEMRARADWRFDRLAFILIAAIVSLLFTHFV